MACTVIVCVVVDVDDKVVVSPLSDDPPTDDAPLSAAAVLEEALLAGEVA